MQQRRVRRDAESTPTVRRPAPVDHAVSVSSVPAIPSDAKIAGEPALADGWVAAKGILWPPPGPGSGRYRRLYIRGRTRATIAVISAVLWSLISLYLARFWIADLGRQITLPLAIIVIGGIAMIPGYLNMQLLMSLLLDRPPRLREPENLVFPPVSVLVAAYNEEETLIGTLRSLAAQTYPSEIRVIVIDDGSSDRTRSVVHGYRERNPNEHVTIMTVPHHGKADALNAGLATLNTPLAATLDADTVLLADSMRRAVTRMLMTGPQTSAVAGSVLVKNWRQNILTRMQRWEYALGIASVKRVQALYQGTLVAQGAFSVYTTEDLRKIAGWPNLIGEDIVMTWALLAKGDIVVYEPTAVALTCVPEHLR
ncbi:MAG: glycosyltransferase family 2 protein, partial [Solirubrobacterales bacterium]